MELLSYYFITFAFLLAIFLSFLKAKAKAKAFPAKPTAVLRLPPSPWQLPIIGSMHHLLVGWSLLPHQALRDLSRKYGPLMLLKIGETPTIIASSMEAAKEIMKTQDINFANRPNSVTSETLSWGGKDILFAPYGEYWRQIRKVSIVMLFSPKRVQLYGTLREEEVKILLHKITTAAETTGLVNLSELMTAFVNDTTVRAAIGARHKEHPKFLHTWGTLLELGTGSNMMDLFPSMRWLTDIVSSAACEAERCKRTLGTLFENIMNMKRERSAISGASYAEDEDLLDALLKMHEDESSATPLDLDSIKGVLLDMFGAGGETSSITLGWAMSELLRHPRALERAQEEVRSVLKGNTTVTNDDVSKLPYIQNVIKETLRLHGPVPILTRESQADCTILGYDIPKNTKILVNAWALGRDPKYWDEPDDFKPERFRVHAVDYRGSEIEYIPFGAGCRQCPGTSFGIAMVELCLANLLYHFDWELPRGVKPDKLDMSEWYGVILRRKNHLFLRPVLCVPCPAA